jgi:hypothetical protein
MQQDPWDAAGPHPADDPRPGTGVWDVCAGWVKSRWMFPRRLYGWQLVDRLTQPLVVDSKDAAPVWLAGRLRPDADGRLRRCKEAVDTLSMLVLDCDDGAPLDVLRRVGDLDGPGGYSLLRIGHTSFSHKPAHPKARIVFPLARPVPAARWEAVWGAAARWAAAAGVVIDKATKDPSRIWFTAACTAAGRADFVSWVAGGTAPAPGADTGDVALLCPAWLLRAFPEPPPERVNRPITPARFGVDDLPAAERLALRVHRYLEHRVQRLATMAPGAGQAMSAFGNARLVGQAEAAGVCADPAGWLRAIEDAGCAAGLPRRRCADNVKRGHAKGLTEQLEVDDG